MAALSYHHDATTKTVWQIDRPKIIERATGGFTISVVMHSVSAFPLGPHNPVSGFDRLASHLTDGPAAVTRKSKRFPATMPEEEAALFFDIEMMMVRSHPEISRAEYERLATLYRREYPSAK